MALLTTVAIAGILWLTLPLTFVVKLMGTIALFLFLPASLLQEYWPKLQLHDLGWRLPATPRHPAWYAAVVTLIGFLPLGLFLLVDDPVAFAAINPSDTWIAWLIGQGLVAIMFMAQSAFFTGLILFRLTHLLKPAVAIFLVGLIMTLGMVLLPGTLAVFALPLSLAFAWMAWETKSFVPVALTQLLLSLTYDLFVRLS